ncbi:filament-like plant protein [Neltuma alba]|uniref:filament-like plant protein n=1 Tax=Neltuma alba TaxID=207710 RepID=UPI0010A39820|nr:filament-like plant protein [Prosopis alba]XP_028770564.1 filament-like plant protein [Prosopis alba]XP_028770567.1 filament-like plant protein [Prosopis alba]
MDRRSWLWRRKSSEKSPGETESSGSISSHSERFSDDQVYPTQATPSPEVTSKAAPIIEEEVTDVKILTEKLCASLRDIRAKEDLVKQHAKVAEEAVSGWEKAENEVLSLKQQLNAANQKNSALEDRVSHLDGALKECMRQLRQAREEQEQRINEAIANSSRDWEYKISELEVQLQTAKVEVSAPIRSDLHLRLEAVEKENSGLKLELQSRLEELEFRIVERDLSAEAAETASKQQLECKRKVAKLEAECHRLKGIIRKTFSGNDHKSLTASSVYVESFADSLSDNGERLQAIESDVRKSGGWEMNECEPSRSDSWASALITELNQFKNEKTIGKNLMAPSVEITLMDDFLEMERLAALPHTESRSISAEAGLSSDHPSGDQNAMRDELQSVIQKNAELEEKLEKMEADRLEKEMALAECQKQLEASQSRIKEAELKVAELQTKLALANKTNQEAYEELKSTKTKNKETESKLRVVQSEVEDLVSKIGSLEKRIEKERAFSAESVAKSGRLEDELSRMKHESQLRQEAEKIHREDVNVELRLKQEKELALAANRFAECQKTIASLGNQLKSLATLEDFLLDSENPMDLTREVTPSPKNGADPMKMHHQFDFPKRNSESSILLRSSGTLEKGRNGFGKFTPRSKSVSRTGTH